MVASSSLEILNDASLVREDMFPLAGRYFKRFDEETCTFISNVKEKFPED
jgi:F-box protein 21